MNNKPCPFCGNTDLDVQTGTLDREGVPTNMICVTCGASGPVVYEPEGSNSNALKEWNKRTE